MTDAELMQKIFDKYHTGILAPAAKNSVLPESLLAALVANESGGDANALRFEPGVFLSLGEVLIGVKASYSPAGIAHPLGPDDLLAYVAPETIPGLAAAAPPITGGFTARLMRLKQLATSYGLTQIMGWHAVEMSKPFSMLTGGPNGQIVFTVELLNYFAKRILIDFGSSLPVDCARLFRCWNTGKPDGKTFDPYYVMNGLARMKLYEGITANLAPSID